MDYAVCQIGARQYIVKPGSTVEVDKIDGDKLSVNKVLLIVNGDKVEYGSPYLKTTLAFEVVSQKREKIRVAKFKAKSNYRRSHGSVKQTTMIKLVEKGVIKKPKEDIVEEAK